MTLEVIKMRRQVLSAGVLMAAACLAAGAAPAPTPTPVAKAEPILHVENATVDAGDVRPGEALVGTFIFKNTGDRPVKILKAAPS